MLNILNDNRVVKAASVAALAYCASQAVVAGVRVGQFTTAAVQEFRNKDTTETTSDES